MRELDGSAAGGQFVRTALAVAALEDEPVRIENVRGNRSTPGLRPQHLAAFETMAAVCDADVSGAAVGAETITFEPDPGPIPGGEYAVEIGTAGSVTLLFQALVPLATRLESDLSVTVTGGTDVKWSPPLDYLRHVKLPVLARYGIEADLELERRGFYPAGGGEATLRLSPSTLEPITLEDRDALETVSVYSTEAEALADSDVAARQSEGALERLAVDDYDLAVRDRVETTAESDCPGSALVLVLEGGRTRAGFTALGERGKPAERVGEDAADAANRFLEGDAPVDRHMGDQLLVFLARAGGRLSIPAVTDHVETSLDLLASFGYDVGLEGDRTVVAGDPSG